MPIDELLAYVCPDPSHPLATPFAAWLRSSRRFAAFATTYRDKIRKKLRTTTEIASLRDVQAELETAYVLLHERQLSLAYEPYGHGVRSPDFVATFTTSLTFGVEVTRVRNGARHTHHAPTTGAERIADAACSKLRQLLPSMSNVVVVYVEPNAWSASAINGALGAIKTRAERKDAQLWERHGFRDPADFWKQFGRLSHVIVCGAQADQPTRHVLVWPNPQAKHPLPAPVQTVLRRSFAQFAEAPT